MKLQFRLALPLFSVALLVTAGVTVGMVFLVRGTADAVLRQSGRQFQRIVENSLRTRGQEMQEMASVLGMLEGSIGARSSAWKHITIDSVVIFKKHSGKILSVLGKPVGSAEFKALAGKSYSEPCLFPVGNGVIVAGFAPDRNAANMVMAGRLLDRTFAGELKKLLQAEVEVVLGDRVIAATSVGGIARGRFYPVESVFASPGGIPIMVRMFLPVEEVNVIRNQAVILSGAGGIFLLVLVALFIGWTFRRVTRPVRDLTVAVDRMARGEVETVPEGDAPAELGLLIRQFNAMARTLNETQKTLVHSAKLSSVGQLVAGVSHELNNPLLALMGHAEHLATKFPETDPLRKKIDIVVAEAQRMRRILANLRSFARQSGEEKAPVDLNGIAGEVLELIIHEAEKAGVKCLLEVGSGVVATVSADQIRQVMLNFALNALEAMPSGGTLTVRTGSTGKNVWVSVADTGTGIPPEQQTKVMEPFYTTRPGKTGIGLSICQEIAGRQGGSIKMESEMGKGTTMTLVISRTQSA